MFALLAAIFFVIALCLSHMFSTAGAFLVYGLIALALHFTALHYVPAYRSRFGASGV